MNPIARTINFLKESKKELTKVIWPSKLLVFRYTTMVILAVLISVAIVLAFDFLLIKLVQFFVIR